MMPTRTHFRRSMLAGAALLLSLAAHAQGPVPDPTFQPVRTLESALNPQVAGTVQAVAQLPDGKYLVGGHFEQIGGVAKSNLARLLPNGSVDPSFTAAGTDGEVRMLALQPDGKILVGGQFSTLAGGPRLSLGRLLPDGTLDVAFTPPMGNLYDVQGLTNPWVDQLTLLPDGKVLVGGVFNLLGLGANSQRLMRIDGTTGRPDASFTPLRGPWLRHLRLADGKILVGGSVSAYQSGTLLQRFNADGTPDASFTPLPNNFTSAVRTMAPDAAGNVYAGGLFNSAPNGGSNGGALRRVRPDGSNDATFWHRGTLTEVASVTVQADGRLLTSNAFIERLNPDGTLDASFPAANSPRAAAAQGIRQVLVQPGGAILVAGHFTQPGLNGTLSLVRLTETALSARTRTANDRLTVWPVPAQEVLHLRLSAASRAQQVRLQDALGRVVRTVAPQAAGEQALPVAGLPAGVYQLQADFADGQRAIRRVVLR